MLMPSGLRFANHAVPPQQMQTQVELLLAFALHAQQALINTKQDKVSACSALLAHILVQEQVCARRALQELSLRLWEQ